MLAALNTPELQLLAKKSRNHSELIFKYLKLPIKVKKTVNYDLIKIRGKSSINPLNYKIIRYKLKCFFYCSYSVIKKF